MAARCTLSACARVFTSGRVWRGGMSILGSGLMGLFGVAYTLMGACMLAPGAIKRWLPAEYAGLNALYPSVFKRFLQTELAEEAGKTELAEEAGKIELGTGVRELVELEREDLAYRLLAYFLLLLGFLRLFVAFHWGCSFVYLGLSTCLVEMAVVGHELLRHNAVHLHRVMSVLTELCIVSLIFIGTALPHCS